MTARGKISAIFGKTQGFGLKNSSNQYLVYPKSGQKCIHNKMATVSALAVVKSRLAMKSIRKKGLVLNFKKKQD